MRIYNASFSFEVDGESDRSSLTFPTLTKAKSGAIELLKQKSKDTVDAAFKYEGQVDESETLSVEISLVNVVHINAESLCTILNSNGCFYSTGETDLLRITLQVGSKRPTITRLALVKVGTR